jgi:RNA polymerase subunit RPABC4/transcription elongation factor Spt4
MKLFIHFIEATSEAIDTCIAHSDTDLTLKELVQLVIIDYRRDIVPERVTIYKTYKYASRMIQN